MGDATYFLHFLAGWWLKQTWLDYDFHFIWDVIPTPTDELHHFARWLKPPASI
jgi:hypothetical protein